MGIGQDLLNVPFPEMVFKLANSIAQGQRVLDRSSMETARALAKAKVKVLTEFAEVISPVNRTAGGVPYTGANITMENPQYATYTLLQAGLMPTFYQFTESIIEVKISISTRSEFTSEFEIGAEFETTVETEAEAHACWCASPSCGPRGVHGVVSSLRAGRGDWRSRPSGVPVP